MTSVRSEHTTAEDVEPTDAVEHLRHDFPAVSAEALSAAVTGAERELNGVPPEWLAELAERLAWWRISTANGAAHSWTPDLSANGSAR
ncbi:hypothetical protein AB0L63_30050 [Nocardia sp. NPDC051990]|uniref:hypothetical protein n=1 Tax=Nocardia sp. NPDC051990 TaxID=3155285 RepID=UPI00343DFCF4